MNIADVRLSRQTATASRTTDLTVVGGAGHVGVPLVLSFAAAGLTVNVNDINETAIETLKAGRLPFIEHDAEHLLQSALRKQRLIFTSQASEISPAGPVIITIGTPADEFLNAQRDLLQRCIDALLPYLGDGRLLVLRSTLYPGTTDWLDDYLKRRGRNLKIAFCPERIVQGYGIRELRKMPQIVSGTTPEAEQAAAALFGPIVPELVIVQPKEAELAKLFDNAFRYIEFAVSNQFYLIAKSAGLDYHRILQATKHNYPRAKNIPEPGFTAGPCLMKDTLQLAAFASDGFGLGHAAILVNEGLVLHVIDDLRRSFDLATMTVGLLGMAFKADSDDVRASLSYKFKTAMARYAREVLTTDPLVVTDPDLLPLDEVVARSDILVLCAPHSCYKTADLGGKRVVDIWGFLNSTH